jgi:uncharacterized protein YheU (UPF0270 family)
MEELSEEVLGALIEEFVTRHGAIQGEDATLEVKVRQVKKMLEGGKASIVWDDINESATILTKDELKLAEAQRRQMIEDAERGRVDDL